MTLYRGTMPEQRVNGAKLFYELNGSGDPLVLVHGSWVDHKDWQLVVPHLARSFRSIGPALLPGLLLVPRFSCKLQYFYGALGRTRTCDLLCS